MEKNFISNSMATCFYVDIVNKTYGIYINTKDIDRKDVIINYFRDTRKSQIEEWKREWGVSNV